MAIVGLFKRPTPGKEEPEEQPLLSSRDEYEDMKMKMVTVMVMVIRCRGSSGPEIRTEEGN